ncbi:suppressor of fused domain protein [Bradyrhizobium sp. USDA 3650]
MAVSEDNKSLARYLRDVTQGSPTVTKYWDDAHVCDVDIMIIKNVPAGGVSTYASLALSDAKTGLTSGDKALGIEILLALATECAEGANMIATCAFSIKKAEITPLPGAIIPRALELYGEGRDMKHAMLISPFLWDLETQSFSAKSVAWLQVLPISDAERDYALANGPEALEDLFQDRQIDVFDIDRPSAL